MHSLKAVGHRALNSTRLTFIYSFLNFIMVYYRLITRPEEVSKTPTLASRELIFQRREKE